VTLKFEADATVPPGVVTLIFPVVAPCGTLILILVLASEEMVADVPLKVTFVAPDRCVPVMVTVVPGGPDEGVNLVIAGGPGDLEPLEEREP
jgi:hypothetical protein